MIGTSRLDPEKRVCLSAESRKDTQQATSSASNDSGMTPIVTKDDQLPWQQVGKKTPHTKDDMARLDGRSKYAIERTEIHRELTGKALVQKVRSNKNIQPSKVKTPKPPSKEPIANKTTGTINGRSWADITAESEKQEQIKAKGTMNEKHAERSRRTFIIRRAPFNYQPEELLEALDTQFTDDLGEVAERLDSVTRDKYDKRRLYVTFKQYEDKQTVAKRGFRIGNVTIPGEPGDVSGLITDVPHYLDLDDMTELLAPYGTIIRHRFRRYTNTEIRKGTYDFDLQLLEGKHIPTELQIYNDTMTVLDKNQRKHCTYCNRYGHLSSYCRQRMEKEMGRRNDEVEQTAEMVDVTNVVETAVETEKTIGTEVATEVVTSEVVTDEAVTAEEARTDFVAEVVTETVAEVMTDTGVDATTEVVTSVTAEVVVEATAEQMIAVTAEVPPTLTVEAEAGDEEVERDDEMEVSDENLTDRDLTSDDEIDDDIPIETLRKRTTEDENIETKKKKIKKREEICTKDERRETMKEKAMNKEEQEHREKMKRYYAKQEEKKKKEQEEKDKKNMEKKKVEHEDEGDTNIDKEYLQLEEMLRRAPMCNGNREYTTLSSTPIANKTYVKQAWTPKRRNPSIEIPLRKLSKQTTFPEAEVGEYNSVTGNIVRTAREFFQISSEFNIDPVIEVSKCRTKLYITCTKPYKNARLRNIQMRAFIGIIDNLCEKDTFYG